MPRDRHLAPAAPPLAINKPLGPLSSRAASALQRQSPDRDLGGTVGGINRFGQPFGRSEVRSQRHMMAEGYDMLRSHPKSNPEQVPPSGGPKTLKRLNRPTPDVFRRKQYRRLERKGGR